MTRIFGIRHHGPGSGLSLRAALEEYAPDCVLIEGPPEADSLLALLRDPGYQPPLALLLSQVDAPQHSVFYPFAAHSPEWIAIQYAQASAVAVRFCDWPAAASMAFVHEQAQAPEPDVGTAPRPDPIALLAAAADAGDAELWWDGLIEQQTSAADVFEAISEAMAEGRAGHLDPRNALREAAMRQAVREACKAGAQRIALVCGAYHAPALSAAITPKADAPLLAEIKRLSKAIKLHVAWVPWSQSRLSLASAYGAGMPAPAWYADMFVAGERAHVRFLARAAVCLRAADLEASSASVIEAVRLAETLSAMRGRRLPGLAEVREAALSVLARGDANRYALIANTLEINEAFGTVAADAPSLPLKRDFECCLRALKLKRTAEIKSLDLDLREQNGLARSCFFHRCRMLGLQFAAPEVKHGRTLGSFHEYWTLRFVPEDEIKLLEASQLGASVHDAACAQMLDGLADCALDEICTRLQSASDAQLNLTVPKLLSALGAASAQGDASLLLAALPPLLNLHRYGSLRGFAPNQIAPICTVMLERLSAGLQLVARGINSEAASAILAQLARLSPALESSEEPAWQAAFAQALESLDGTAVHPMLRGYAARFAFEQGAGDSQAFSAAARLALSPVVPPADASDWILGALKGPALVLSHGALLGLIDSWLRGLHEDDFSALLPGLRRAFSEFDRNERRIIGERVAQGERALAPALSGIELDPLRVQMLLPTLQELLR